jgi:hypothetical protein
MVFATDSIFSQLVWLPMIWLPNFMMASLRRTYAENCPTRRISAGRDEGLTGFVGCWNPTGSKRATGP